MLTFYLMFYNNTLNMMRQWMAMSLLLFGFSYLINNERRKYFIVVICGCLFHMSAVMGVIIYFVFTYVKKRGTQNHTSGTKSQLRFGIVLFISLIFIGLAGNIGTIMYAIGLGRFAVYLDGDFSLLPNQFLIRLPMLVIFAWSWKHLKKQSMYSYYYLAMMWMDLVLSQLISINSFAIRIPYFFSEFFLIINPTIAASVKSKEKRILIVCLTTTYLIIYWLFFYVYKGSNETVPYMFGW